MGGSELTGGVWDEDDGEGKAQEAQPCDHPELGVVIDIIVKDGWCEGAQFPDSC